MFAISDPIFNPIKAPATTLTIPSTVTRINDTAFNKASITSVTFEDPTGWKVCPDATCTSSTNVTLTNPTTNATYLKSTHLAKFWVKD